MTTNQGAPLGSAATITVTPGRDVDEYAGTNSIYDDRGPISTLLLTGAWTAGLALQLTTSSKATSEQAEDEARAAEHIAEWARRHAVAARQHADRLKAQPLTGGGAMCPCGARMTWTGETDYDALSEWDAVHDECEVRA